MADRVTIVIIDYKSAEATLSYLDEIKNNIYPNDCIDIIIVDNTRDRFFLHDEKVLNSIRINEYKSICGHESAIASYRDIPVVICYADDNLGYAKGNNLGFEISEEIFKNKYVIFSNNDLLFRGKFNLESFLSPFENNCVAAVGPSVVDISGKIQQNPHKYLSFWQDTVINFYHMLSDRLFGFWESDIDYSGDSKICDWLSGCFMAVRARYFGDINGFDDNTFLYSEEVILSERFDKLGKVSYFNNDVCIVHNHSSVVKDNMSEVNRMRLSVESTRYYYSRYKGVKRGKLILASILFEIFVPLYLIKQFVKKIIGRA